MDAPLDNPVPGANANVGSRLTMDRIRRVFIESLQLNLEEGDLDYRHQLDETVALDSIAILEFVVALEKEFGIRIEPEMLRLGILRDLPRLAGYMEDRSSQPDAAV